MSPAVIPVIETHTDFWQTSGRLLAEDRMIIDLKTQRDPNWWLHAFKDWNGRVVKQNVIQEQILQMLLP